MNARLRNQIRKNMSQKETDELLRIWEKHDQNEWSDLTFDVIREILQDRQIQLPQQAPQQVEKEPMEEVPTTLKSYKWIFLGLMLLYTLSLIAKSDSHIPLAVSILIAVIPNGVLVGIWYFLYRKVVKGKSGIARGLLVVITFPLGLILVLPSVDEYMATHYKRK